MCSICHAAILRAAVMRFMQGSAPVRCEILSDAMRDKGYDPDETADAIAQLKQQGSLAGQTGWVYVP